MVNFLHQQIANMQLFKCRKTIDHFSLPYLCTDNKIYIIQNKLWNFFIFRDMSIFIFESTYQKPLCGHIHVCVCVHGCVVYKETQILSVQYVYKHWKTCSSSLIFYHKLNNYLMPSKKICKEKKKCRNCIKTRELKVVFVLARDVWTEKNAS